MNLDPHIDIPMPALSPEAAYALSAWIACIAHEVDLYYGDEIRSYLAQQDQEITTPETVFGPPQPEPNGWDDEFPF